MVILEPWEAEARGDSKFSLAGLLSKKKKKERGVAGRWLSAEA